MNISSQTILTEGGKKGSQGLAGHIFRMNLLISLISPLCCIPNVYGYGDIFEKGGPVVLTFCFS